ncbi:MAG: LysE family translocator [Alphaproteobacteria bacterium]|nr:LysE family translocator [Alphaproteobacteria bacterium]
MTDLLPTVPSLLAFLAAGLALNLTPGPDMLYCAARGAAGGRRAGIVSALGIGAGCLVHTGFVALGLAALLMASSLAYEVIRWVGAAYLLWIAWATWRQGELPPNARDVAPAGMWRVFAQGALINVLNPKVALFFLAFLPQFVDPAGGDVAPKLIVLGMIFNFNGTLINLIVGALAGEAGRFLARHAGWWRWQNRVAAGLLAALAARLALAPALGRS